MLISQEIWPNLLLWNKSIINCNHHIKYLTTSNMITTSVFSGKKSLHIFDDSEHVVPIHRKAIRP
jgi:esterase/lipase